MMSSSMLDWFLNTLTPTEPHVPSTAEIIQKCLNVNPFDIKFREANLQNNQSHGSPEQQQQQQQQQQRQFGAVTSQAQQQLQQSGFGAGGSTANAALPSMLKLPSLSSQSPGIFSNISVLSADFEDEIRKTIDISRKLRESQNRGDDSKREPRTADVIDGVIDVEFNRSGGGASHLYHQLSGANISDTTTSSSTLTIPQSTPSLLTGSMAAAAQDLIQAYSNQLAASMHNNNNNNSNVSGSVPTAIPSSSSTTTFLCAPSTSLASSMMSNPIDVSTSSTSTSLTTLGGTGNNDSNAISQMNLAAATTAAFLRQKSSIVSMALNSSSTNTIASGTDGCTTLSVPILPSTQHISMSAHGSPRGGAVGCASSISPRNNFSANVTELKKTSSVIDLMGSGLSSIESQHSISSAPSLAGDPWENAMDVKPTVSKHNHIGDVQHQFYADDHSSAFSSGASVGDSQEIPPSLQGRQSGTSRKMGQQKDRPRKYTRYNTNSNGSTNDSQVSSTRGGRGRRSITSDMPADERRVTILERNKAAAVRYRKRKKEEHDEMIGRVHEIEQENNALQTRNQVLVREIERLTNLLKTRDARCVCRANQIGITNMLATPVSVAAAMSGGAMLEVSKRDDLSHSPIHFTGAGDGGGGFAQIPRQGSEHP